MFVQNFIKQSAAVPSLSTVH